MFRFVNENSLKKFKRGLCIQPFWPVLVLSVVLLATLSITSPFAIAPVSRTVKQSKTVDLLNGQDWSHFAGAVRDSKGVHILPLGRAVVNQDGSGGQPNPPVNVRGPHLLVDGDFKVSFKLSGQPASFYLYSSVPVIYDEWRYEPPHLRLELNKDSLILRQWDGTSKAAVKQKTWRLPKAVLNDVTLRVYNHYLAVEVNGKKLGTMENRRLFTGRNVWFGADAPVGGKGWTLSALNVNQLNGGKVKVVSGDELKTIPTSSQSLRALSTSSARQLPIGTAVSTYPLFSDSDYRKLVASQFSLLTPENELKAQFVHPQPNIYSFADADSLVDFAEANSMSVHGHALVFGEANPRWMQNALPANRQKIMTDHITTVMEHFGNRIGSWDVVNEPLLDDASTSHDVRRNIWFAAMGESYIDTAFKTARAANPSAKLYINEYGLEADGPKWEAFLALVSRLRGRGVPVDGVGFQAHIYESADEINSLVLQKHMQALAKLGLASRISEIDVYGDDLENQAVQYSETLRACLAEPGCTSFTTWGVTDWYGSTTRLHSYPLELGDDLLWNKSLQPKPALTSLQNALRVLR